MYFKFGC
jgi:hypothetical protein